MERLTLGLTESEGLHHYPRKYLLVFSLSAHHPSVANVKNHTQLCEEDDHHFFASVLPGNSISSDWHVHSLSEPLVIMDDNPSSTGNNCSFFPEEDEKESWSVIVADTIHNLADKLPLKGYLLDVMWYMDNSHILLEDHMTLFGALSRLKCWHNARISFSPLLENMPESNLKLWKSVLYANPLRSTPELEKVLADGVMWRGNLVLMEGKSDVFVSLPGFELVELKDEVSIRVTRIKADTLPGVDNNKGNETPMTNKHFVCYENNMEVVDMVDLYDVPRCLLMPEKLKVTIPAAEYLPRSSEFLQWLANSNKDNGHVALVVELPYTISSEVQLCGEVGLSTEQWKKQIADDNEDFSAPPGIFKLPDNHESVYLLVYGDHCGNCCAQPFVPMDNLNGSFHAKAAHMDALGFFSERDPSQPSSDPCDDVLHDLPLLSGSCLQEMLDNVAELQLQALKTFAEHKRDEGGTARLSLDELQEMFSMMSKDYLSSIDWKEKASDVLDASNIPLLDISNIPSDLDQDPSMWLERLALYNKEAVSEKMKRSKSSDMTLGGIAVPLPVNDTITVHVNASEFLKHFKPNGLPVGQDFSPIGITTRSRSSGTPSKHKGHSVSLSSDEVAKMSFKETFKLSFPGIHYCIHTTSFNSLDVDQKFSRLQQRLVRSETSSTCSQDSGVAVIKLPRRSPRKTPRKAKKICDSPIKSQLKSSGNLKRSRESYTERTPRKRPRTFADQGAPSSQPELTKTTPQKSQRTPKVEQAKKTFSSPRQLTPRKISSRVISLPTQKSKRTPQKSSKQKKESNDNKTVKDNATLKLRDTPQEIVTPSHKEGHVAVRRSPRKPNGKEKQQTQDSQKNRKLSRSELHNRKLHAIVEDVLKSRGVDKTHKCFEKCSSRLFSLTKSFVKDLKTSHGLFEEMKKIADSNADLVVQFEVKNTK